MSAKKPTGIEDLPLPPLPKWARPKDDPEYAAPEAVKPEDLRARLQLLAGMALDMLEFHACNPREPKTSIESCGDILDRAGYVAPAKVKAEMVSFGGGGGEALPSIEDDVRALNASNGVVE